ncbi:MAG: GatB/YqeY domain-containing protein, partial [Bacteroidales bacterium]
KTAKDSNGELTDETATRILQKMVKQRKDAAEIFHTQNRQDLADSELAEVAIIEQYLPKQMSEAELEAALKEIIAQANATSAKEMGKVMGIASKQLAGKAEGKAISAKVKELLS